jgi:26S proteasome regulatory subunit N1
MTYGEPNIRKCVPLALGLISASKPQLPIIDALSKYSHDQDLDVALNAIFAMGLVGAGTNNARLAQMLRMLAVYYATQADCLFVIRIAQVRQAVRPSIPSQAVRPSLSFPQANMPSPFSPLTPFSIFLGPSGFLPDLYHLHCLRQLLYSAGMGRGIPDSHNIPTSQPHVHPLCPYHLHLDQSTTDQ